MALMAAHGEIKPMPDAAIFADTGWEPKAVYEQLEWLMSPNTLPFPVHVTSKGSTIQDDLIEGGLHGKRRFAAVPFFVRNPDGSQGRGPRQCTKEYKVYPLRDKAKELLDAPEGKRIPPGSIESWIGISTDEAVRMKPSTVKYMVNRWPLIEQRMSRWDCLNWLERNGYPAPPKSSCIGCPFHSNTHWRHMKHDDPEAWGAAVEMDRKIRSKGTMKGMRGAQYIHRSLVPLDKVDLRSHLERGQPDLFGEECEGMCGV